MNIVETLEYSKIASFDHVMRCKSAIGTRVEASIAGGPCTLL
jgi:hypothetical protein